jgi:hypothetical protein
MPNDLPGWDDADRISDRVIDLANEEFQRRVSPLQVFAGIMLGLMGVMRSAPKKRPIEMVGVEAAISLCLNSMLESKRWGEPK